MRQYKCQKSSFDCVLYINQVDKGILLSHRDKLTLNVDYKSSNKQQIFKKIEEGKFIC